MELERLKMETVIGVEMWCEMGMRLISHQQRHRVRHQHPQRTHDDLHKVAVQATRHIELISSIGTR